MVWEITNQEENAEKEQRRLLLWRQWAPVEHPGSANGQTGGNEGRSSDSKSGHLLIWGTLHHEEHMPECQREQLKNSCAALLESSGLWDHFYKLLIPMKPTCIWTAANHSNHVLRLFHFLQTVGYNWTWVPVRGLCSLLQLMHLR